MREIFVREKGKMVEIGDLAKDLAKKKGISYKRAFSYIFNEASSSISYAKLGLDDQYRLATKGDLLQRLIEEKDKTDGREQNV
jgi:hypothetical protein